MESGYYPTAKEVYSYKPSVRHAQNMLDMLSMFELEAAPEYKALLYVWGKTDNPVHIVCPHFPNLMFT
jgi:hypothetical protein